MAGAAAVVVALSEGRLLTAAAAVAGQTHQFSKLAASRFMAAAGAQVVPAHQVMLQQAQRRVVVVVAQQAGRRAMVLAANVKFGGLSNALRDY